MLKIVLLLNLAILSFEINHLNKNQFVKGLNPGVISKVG